jgi:hypothetical protein
MLNLILSIFLAVAVPESQNEYLFTIQGNYKIAGVDLMGNCYLVNKNTIYKYTSEGKQLHNYSNPQLGQISHVNISNPMKILVLYADRGVIEVLDNTLSPVGNTFNLHSLSISDPIAACTSDNNGFWVYDAATGCFVQFNMNGSKINQSSDVRRLFDTAFFPDDMVMWSGYVLATSSSAGSLIIDQTGTIFRVLAPLKKIQHAGTNGLSYYQENTIFVIDPVSQTESKLSAEFEGLKSYSLNFPYLIIEFEKKISLYLLSAE